jgi:HD superfamily phosphohydrolase
MIQDSVHGSIAFEGVFLSLIDSPELQRLHGIHQLGLAYLVYPGANHTRLEHSLGTFSVASRISAALELEEAESQSVRCAALLHDVGHLPFSHTFEVVLHEVFGIDHAEISRRLIRGEETALSERDRKILGKHASIPEVLESAGIEPKEVASLLEGRFYQPSPQRTLSDDHGQAHFNGKRYMSQIVNSTVDADQLDYLVRDAYYTGVAYGVIDLDRLVETLRVFNDDLVVDRSGLSAVEGMLVARALMFSSVYFHKTVRISELMLAKAVEGLGRDEIQFLHRMTDSALLAHLISRGGYPEEIATMIKYRRLFKRAFYIPVTEVEEGSWDEVDRLGVMKNRRSLEEEIARRAGVDPGYVVVDIPSNELPISEPRLNLTDVRILDRGKVKMLPKISSIASSLQTRKVFEHAVTVACPEKHRAKVQKASERLIQL